MEKSNRLYRSNTDKVIGGVSGGLANYLGVDPVLIRVAFVLLTLFGGGGVLIYIVMWIAIPAETIDYKTAFNNADDTAATTATTPVTDAGFINKNQSNTALISGIILIIIGLLFLADRLIPFYNLRDFWPVILIVVGILIMKPDLLKGKPVINAEVNSGNNPGESDNQSNNHESKNA